MPALQDEPVARTYRRTLVPLSVLCEDVSNLTSRQRSGWDRKSPLACEAAAAGRQLF